ncbi:NUDIX domain-containing protein [Streptomyces tanashiensis]|uniref:NUDIX domain-containing protein n=1 Tax=Streptomyces tanashiensis TaxID=67367 RepID=UPI003423C65E
MRSSSTRARSLSSIAIAQKAWTSTPFPGGLRHVGEVTAAALARELEEELGLDTA